MLLCSGQYLLQQVKVPRIGVQDAVASSTCRPVAVSLAIGRGIIILFWVFIGIKNRQVPL
jgi:hypothetical protein